MLPWKTMIPIDRTHDRAVYLQIAEGIIREISQGRLQAGRRLPGTRKLGEFLGVNRKTAVWAYDELMGQGWVEIRPSSGVFVAENLPLAQYRKLKAKTVSEKAKSSDSKTIDSHPFVPAYQTILPHRIFVGEGSPDVRLAPMDILLRNCRSLARSYSGNRLMGYGHVQGPERPRQILADYLQQTRGLTCNSEQTLFTRGSQMGIYLFFRTLLRPGDKVLVTDPNYDVADWTIQSMGGTLIRVPVDADGMHIQAVEQICKQHKIRAAYITPHHHFPTTVTLSAERRLRLLALAERHDFYILEDDYDYTFHYQRAPILPLASIDESGRVVYLGSFSKLIAPSVRVGYLVAPPAWTVAFGKLRRIIDRQGDPLMESAVCQMIEDGDLQRHLKKVLQVYRDRRDHCCNLLKSNLSSRIGFYVPEGGMAVWLRFLNPIDGEELCGFAKKNGVHLDVDLDILKRHNCMRLGFASLTKKEMTEVLEMLKVYLRAKQ